VILTDQGASGGFGRLIKLKDTFKKKDIFIFLGQSFRTWLQSFNKLVIRQPNKCFKKFENIIKNENFHVKPLLLRRLFSKGKICRFFVAFWLKQFF